MDLSMPMIGQAGASPLMQPLLLNFLAKMRSPHGRKEVCGMHA